MNNLAEEKHFTYADYIAWDDEIRCEIIEGIAYPLYGGDEKMLKGLLQYIDAFRKSGIDDEKIERIIIEYIDTLIYDEVDKLLVLNLNKLKYDRSDAPQGNYEKSKMSKSGLSTKRNLNFEILTEVLKANGMSDEMIEKSIKMLNN